MTTDVLPKPNPRTCKCSINWRGEAFLPSPHDMIEWATSYGQLCRAESLEKLAQAEKEIESLTRILKAANEDFSTLSDQHVDQMKRAQAAEAREKELRAQLDERDRRIAELEAERDAIKLQAQGWSMEAKAQRGTVRDSYQAVSGAAGEPGDWNGAEPIRGIVAERDALRAELDAIRAQLIEAQQVIHHAGQFLKRHPAPVKTLEPFVEECEDMWQKIQDHLDDRPPQNAAEPLVGPLAEDGSEC